MSRTAIYSIIGFFYTIMIGALLHFAYEWSGRNEIVAAFAPVNESLWEHLKMLFWPMLAYGVIEYIAYGKNYKNFIPLKVASFLIGILFIIILISLYTSLLKRNILFLDITIFIIGAALSYLYCNINLEKGDKFTSETANIVSLICLLILMILFIYFTFKAPKLPMFKNPHTGEYGIMRNI
jgi:hypothetical protein